MTVFYEINPVDTLFFRGSKPLEAGQLTNAGLFPPPVSVLQGAFRTASLLHHKVDFKKYASGDISDQVVTFVGRAKEPAPFDITCFLLKKDGLLYAQAPYSWFVELKEKSLGPDYEGLKVIWAQKANEDFLESLSVKTSSMPLPLVVSPCEVKTLGGCWIRLELLQKQQPFTLGKNDILSAEKLYTSEDRTGISLLDEAGKPTRKVKDGALFSAAHIRLAPGVSMVVGISAICGLQKEGLMTIGGEKRMCGYKETTVKMPALRGDLYVSLTPIKADKEALSALFCTGKITATAGWDLVTKFHKKTVSWLPAGSVFTKNINNLCVNLAQ